MIQNGKGELMMRSYVLSFALAIIALTTHSPAFGQEAGERSIANTISEKNCDGWNKAKSNYLLVDQNRGLKLWKFKESDAIGANFVIVDKKSCWVEIFASGYAFIPLELSIDADLSYLTDRTTSPKSLSSLIGQLTALVNARCKEKTPPPVLSSAGSISDTLMCKIDTVRSWLKRGGLWQFSISSNSAIKGIFLISHDGVLMGGYTLTKKSDGAFNKLDFTFLEGK